LINVKAILGTQELVAKERKEEEARKQRKIKRAQNAFKKAKKTLQKL
jgi:DNA-binding protein H-NS